MKAPAQRTCVTCLKGFIPAKHSHRSTCPSCVPPKRPDNRIPRLCEVCCRGYTPDKHKHRSICNACRGRASGAKLPNPRDCDYCGLSYTATSGVQRYCHDCGSKHQSHWLERESARRRGPHALAEYAERHRKRAIAWRSKSGKVRLPAGRECRARACSVKLPDTAHHIAAYCSPACKLSEWAARNRDRYQSTRDPAKPKRNRVPDSVTAVHCAAPDCTHPVKPGHTYCSGKCRSAVARLARKTKPDVVIAPVKTCATCKHARPQPASPTGMECGIHRAMTCRPYRDVVLWAPR